MTTENESGIDRRSVIKKAGVAGAGALGLATGSASASDCVGQGECCPDYPCLEDEVEPIDDMLTIQVADTCEELKNCNSETYSHSWDRGCVVDFYTHTEACATQCYVYVNWYNGYNKDGWYDAGHLNIVGSCCVSNCNC